MAKKNKSSDEVTVALDPQSTTDVFDSGVADEWPPITRRGTRMTRDQYERADQAASRMFIGLTVAEPEPESLSEDTFGSATEIERNGGYDEVRESDNG